MKLVVLYTPLPVGILLDKVWSGLVRSRMDGSLSGDGGARAEFYRWSEEIEGQEMGGGGLKLF